MCVLNDWIQLATALALVCVWPLTTAAAQTNAQPPKRVLVVSVTAGFRHSAIPVGDRVLGELAAKSKKFIVEYAQQPPGDLPPEPRKPAEPGPDADELARRNYEIKLAQYDEQMANYRAFYAARMMELKDALHQLTAEKLKDYDAVIFNNTTGDLPLPDKAAFLKWIEAGGGFVGIHAATDTFRGHKPLDPYVQMLGAEFESHGPQVEVEVINQDPTHPACRHLPKTLRVFDEIYLFNGFDSNAVHCLLGLDKHPNTKQPGYYPVAWCKQYGKGRVFYTSLGHREDVWDPEWQRGGRRNDPAVAEAFQKHLLGGILWVLGLETAGAEPQKAKEAVQ